MLGCFDFLRKLTISLYLRDPDHILLVRVAARDSVFLKQIKNFPVAFEIAIDVDNL